MFKSGPYKYNMNDFGHSMSAMTKTRGANGGAKYPVYKAKAPLSRTGGRLGKMPENPNPTKNIKKRVSGKRVSVKGKEAFRGKRKRKRPGRPRKVGRPKGSKNKK